MGALERVQHVWHRRLHPERHPCETAVRQHLQRFGSHRVGVGFGRDLGIIGKAEPVAQGADHPHQVVRREHRGRAAADEHRRDRRRLVTQHPYGEVDLPNRGVRVRTHARARAELGQGVGVEVAVAAPHPTEGHVQVDPERLVRQRLQRRRRQVSVGRDRFTIGQRAGHWSILADVDPHAESLHQPPQALHLRPVTAGAPPVAGE